MQLRIKINYFSRFAWVWECYFVRVKNLKTKYFCILFSDGSTNPEEIPQLYNHLKKTNSDFVFGSRYLKNASSDDDTIITFLGNQIFTFLGKILFNLKISDILYTFVIGKQIVLKSLI